MRIYFLEGQRFGKLLVKEYYKSKKYLCLCDCGIEKLVLTNSLIRGNTKSCGCIDSINRINYDEDCRKKLLNSIKITESGCWEWKKSCHKQGYGNFPYKRKVLLAHRASWILFKGILDDKILVCHKCDNPPCCNPDHLFLGTDKDNVKDGFSKGRIKRKKGEQHYFHKLKEEDILIIRKMALAGDTFKEIAKKFSVHRTCIGSVVNRKSWKHI